MLGETLILIGLPKYKRLMRIGAAIFSWCFFAFVICFGDVVYAQASNIDPTRESIQDSYQKRRRTDQNLFSTAPLEHVIPQRNIITIGLGYNKIDLKMAPDGVNVDDDLSVNNPYRQILTLKGWEASPLVAFSAKNFGIGFSGEYGKKEVVFKTESEYQSYNFMLTESKVDYSGLGIDLYYIPSLNLIPDFIHPTLILGSKSLSAVHVYRSDGSNYISSESYKFKYNVRKSIVGLDLGIQLAKRFTVFPWVNLNLIHVSEAQAMSRTQQVDASFIETDQSLFWFSDPLYTYGVDFAVEFGKVNIHFGGALGFLGSLSRSNDSVRDSSLNVSLGYAFKAN